MARKDFNKIFELYDKVNTCIVLFILVCGHGVWQKWLTYSLHENFYSLFNNICFKHKHKYTGQWDILKIATVTAWVYFWVLKVALISMHRVCPVWISPPALLEFLALASPQCISVSLNRANSVLLMTAPLILIDWQLQVAHSPSCSHTQCTVGCWDIWIPREEIWHKRRQHMNYENYEVSKSRLTCCWHIRHTSGFVIYCLLMNFAPIKLYLSFRWK